MRASSVLASAVALSMFLSVICLVPYHSSAQPGAALLPPVAEHVEDTDADGFYDYLVLEVTVEIYEVGDYGVDMKLNDSLGSNIVTWAGGLPLTLGVHVVSFPTDGIDIWKNGVDGPYFASIYLRDADYTVIGATIHATEAYSFEEFEPLPADIWYTPVTSGSDIDGNGRSEFFMVTAQVNVIQEDDYTFRCSVVKLGVGVYIRDYEEEVHHLGVGLHSVSVSIRGSYFNAAGVDGPYYVGLSVLGLRPGTSDLMFIDTVTFTTHDYDYKLFEAGSVSSSLSTSAPTIDGAYGDGEWDDATLVDLGRPDMENPFGVAMLVKNNLTHLQVCLDAVSDVTEESGDCAAVSFDTGNDNEAADGHEDQFLVGSSFAGQTVHLTYSSASSDWEIDCGPFDPTAPGHVGLAAASGFGPSPSLVDDHRVYEFSIPLELIGAVPGTVIGFAVSSDLVHGVFDESLNNGSSWPYFMEPGAPLTDFGDLTIGWPPIKTTASWSGTLGNEGWYVSPVTIMLAATGGELGVDRTMYDLDDGVWEEYVSSIECAEDGPHVLDYRSYDLGGNSDATQSLEFKIDLTAPTTNKSLSGWNLTLNATDLVSGVLKTSYRVDGGPWSNYTGPIQLTSDANHTVEYYSVDFAGNLEETRTLKVEKEELDVDEDVGGGGLGLSFWFALLIIALLILIAIPKMFGMRRKAKESDARAAVKDIGTAMSQYVDDTTVKKEEPPKPPESGG